ncbi:methyltransferase regulatory domain-containing protein [Ancylobacter oerskovii]|uniref:Methyltransferase regulatory domain-containing protein n=1 Tax=Ancylobacter oerskovii TaxID=459519 RepID=A0ABW4Z4X8_9HYPH|nr:methyltransferase regulatory domain-containing protein [Ancylobacter oerskovii]
MSWSYGYFTDLNYSYGYYPEMSPSLLRLVCLGRGVEPQLPEEPTYLELGFGQGVSLKENPILGHHLEKLTSQTPNYIAHEYLNADWHLEQFSDIARSLDEAKLTFVGSARLLDDIDALQLSAKGRALVLRIGHPIMRETARDYLMNRRFRCDVFVKGARRLLGSEHRDAWQAQTFVLVRPPEDIPTKIPCSRGEAELPADKYAPVTALLSDDGFRRNGSTSWCGIQSCGDGNLRNSSRC